MKTRLAVEKILGSGDFKGILQELDEEGYQIHIHAIAMERFMMQ